MAKELVLDLSPETAKEMPMVDLVYEILQKSEEPLYYRDLTKKIAEIKGFSEEEMLSYMAQLYTEINIDGRFICVGRSLWGLKERYTMEQGTDAAVAANVKDDYDDNDYLEDEEIEEYDEEELQDEDGDDERLDSDADEYDGDDVASDSDDEEY